MPEQLPALQHSETDGNGPAKRRRRPALSCVECRMRKVKCDREEPCGACTRIKSPTCTYRTQPRAGIRSGKSPADISTSANGSAGNESPPRSSPQPFAPLDNFEWAINRYIAPGLFGPHARPQLSPLPSERQVVNLGESSLINDLTEKVSGIQKQLSALSTDGALGLTPLPMQDTARMGSSPPAKANAYGDSHLRNFLEHDNKGNTSAPKANRSKVYKSTELYVPIASVKRANRAIRSNHRLRPFIDQEVLNSIPSKDVCDQLVHCYLRTFEGVFRVLHIPSFLKEYETYWSGTIPDKPSVILKIILVCAIGVSFYSGPSLPQLRAASTLWIQAAGAWLSAPHEKTRLNMPGIQIHILLLLARQVCNVNGDMIWIPAGSLLRAAMQLGLHRDPDQLEEKSFFLAEMRRRLWATVLEITAQSSVDMGMPPMISPADWDTKPPSNVNDEDIGEDISTFEPKPATEFTQSSIQIAFTETLSTRLEIIRLINNLRFELSYDMSVRLSKKLATISREKTMFFQSFLGSNAGPTPFQIKLLDTLTRRFILCLHRPFFRKAKEDPQYHYSRKICLETSLTMQTPAVEPIAGQEDDWTKMAQICAGFFKSFFLYSASTIYLELVTQIEEQRQDTSIFAPLNSASSASSACSLSLPPQFRTLRNVLEAAIQTTEARLRNGETNGKALVFLVTALTRIDALAAGADPVLASAEASKNAAQKMAELMRNAYREEWGEDIDLTSPMDLFPDRNQWPTPLGMNSHLDPSSFGDMQAGFGGLDANLGAQASGMANWDNMDLDTFMQDIEIDYDFGESPERWYNNATWDGADMTGGLGTMGMPVPGPVQGAGL